ncbi:P-type ATPase (P-ATPase) Superfamily [Trachipleistophora hominis]|uniref:P-type ATPase (P-ATPase) Superfamily n=1 Tax=Trachipleistophora hominis TaxID=72359 RepID=L7JWG2_TRAHO|nr:P-type ATPase (P-ATPase) Superfamily [Trachipleistophora hominis]
MHKVFYTLKIANITCGSCIPKIQKCLRGLEYVNDVKINIFTKEVQLEMHTLIDSAKIKHIKRALNENGFTVSDNKKYWRNTFYTLSMLYIIQTVIHKTLSIFWVDLVFSTIIEVLCSKRILKGSMAFTDTVILGSHASFVLGCFYDEQNLQNSSLILVMIVLGKFMLETVGNRASECLRSGVTERYMYNNKNLNYEEIKEGHVIVVEKEKHILFDGIVMEGASYVDESSLTGEIKLKEKKKGDHIHSDTYNKTGRIIVHVRRVGEETSLGKLLKQIDHSSVSNTNEITGLFIFIIFVTIGSFMLCALNTPLAQAIETSLSLLIIACPCALNISEPLTILIGTKKLFDNSIVIRDLAVFENLCDIGVLFIDKTGTLTDGTFIVKDFINTSSLDISTVKTLVHTLERRSYHPIASTLTEYCMVSAMGEVLKYEMMSNGIKGRVRYRNAHYDVQIGNDGLLSANIKNGRCFETNRSIKDENYETDNVPKRINDKNYALYTPDEDLISVYVIVNDELTCVFYLEDKIVNGASSALKLLNEQNITTIMLTGDSYRNAMRIAHRLNISKVYANKTAIHKSNIIQNYRKGHVVGMVGDGINDYSAIAHSNVGISVGNVFSGIGHVSLLSKDLHLLYLLLVIGKRIKRRITINYTFSIIYNVAALCACIAGGYYGLVITPGISCICMFLSSLTVVISALTFK